jgi:hypothetical protein
VLLGFVVAVSKVTELTLARSPLALMVTPCPLAIEFPLVPSQITISLSVELLSTVRVVILLNPLAFVVLMIVLFDICIIYIFCARYFSLYIIIYLSEKQMGNTNKHGGIGNKIKHFFKDTVGGGLKKAWDWVTGGIKGIVTTIYDDVKRVVSTLHDDAKGLVGGVSTLVSKTEDTISGTVKSVTHDAMSVGKDVSHDVSSLGSNISKDLSSMAMPLAIGAVAIAAVIILKK